MVALWALVDRPDRGRGLLDRGARRGHQPAGLVDPVGGNGVDVAAALVVTPCCATSADSACCATIQLSLWRAPALAASALCHGGKLVELACPAARCGDGVGQGGGNARIDRAGRGRDLDRQARVDRFGRARRQ